MTHQHDRPFTLRILAALIFTGVYYGLALGLSVRLGLTVLRSGGTYWLTAPLGLIACGGALAWCTLGWLWIRLREEPAYHELNPTSFPALFRVVKETAAQVGVATPTHLFVSQRVNGFSLFWGILGLNVKWTGLGIGAALLPVLSEVQVRGLIAHELGHMASIRARQGDGWYSWAMYNFWSCSETLARSSLWMRIACPQVWYAWVMTHLTWRVACQEEMVADACAVRAVSPHDHGAALEGIAVAQEMWREFLATEVSGLLDLGVLPGNLYEGFRQHVAKATWAERESLLARYHRKDATRCFADGLDEAHGACPAPEYGIMPADRWDPHPKLSERVDHLFLLAPPCATYPAAGQHHLTGLLTHVEKALSSLVLEKMVAARPRTLWKRVDWESLDSQLAEKPTRARRTAARREPARSC